LGVLSIAALLAHLLAFSGLGWAWPDQAAPAPRPAAAVQVRVVDAAGSVAPAAASPVGEPVAVPTPVVAPQHKLTMARPRLLPNAPLVAPVMTLAVAEPSVAAVQPVATVLPAVVSTVEAVAGSDSIPHYRTEMPPAITLRYVLQRGALRGSGDLSWRPDGDHYELKLEGRVAGLSVLTQISSGGFDAAGVAPLRFTDQRLRRGTTAANFQRTADKITYSGAPDEFALRAGAQDRLSWMVQLAAIVAAEPQLATPGAKVVMYVTGSRGDAGVWSFRCIGPEGVAARGGTINAIKFMREPREAHDTTVQVWLDPTQHDLPVRATQKSGPNDEGYELRLLEVLASN
jgi:hypothetical protein